MRYFSFQPVLHDWCNKDCVLSCLWDDEYKRTHAAIAKSSPCGGRGVFDSLSEWYFTICPTPYNRK